MKEVSKYLGTRVGKLPKSLNVIMSTDTLISQKEKNFKYPNNKQNIANQNIYFRISRVWIIISSFKHV